MSDDVPQETETLLSRGFPGDGATPKYLIIVGKIFIDVP